MVSKYEVEVTVTSAKDLKNVNWRHGSLKPYAVLWVDPKAKCSTKVAEEDGDTCPAWNEKLVIPFDTPLDDSTLFIDIVHADAAEDTKPLIGSARLPLREVVEDAGFGGSLERKLELKRPSGRPQGKLEVKVTVRQPSYPAPGSYYPPPYGVPPPGSRDYPAPPPYGSPYGAAPPPPGGYGAPPVGYPYGAAPPPPVYGGGPAVGYGGQPAYGQVGYGGAPAVGQVYGEEKKKSKYGIGTGLAVGAVAGALGGLALAEGIDHLEDKIADDAAERVEDDLGYDGDDF